MDFKDYTHTEMIDGHPCTYNKLFRHELASIDDELLSNQPPEIQAQVLEWIKENLRSRKTPLWERSSYGLKHLLEDETDIYLTNNAFKDAMLQCGFEPCNLDELNWCFRISKRSPAFVKERERKGW